VIRWIVVVFMMAAVLATLCAASADVGGPPQTQRSRTAARRAASTAAPKHNIYVPTFTSTRSMEANLLISLTDDFETRLLETGCYDVLERRELDRVVSELRSERSVSSILDLNIDASRRLQSGGATAVAFGDIDEDQGSGEFVIRVKIETFSAQILWKKAVSLKKGLLSDRESRLAALGRLLDGACSGRSTNSGGTGIQRGTNATGEEDDSSLMALQNRLIGKWLGKSSGPQGIFGYTLTITFDKIDGLVADARFYPTPEDLKPMPARFKAAVVVNPAGVVSIVFKRWVENPGGYGYALTLVGTVTEDGQFFHGTVPNDFRFEKQATR
jgi:hypothetical protein